MKTLPIEWKKTFASLLSYKGPVSCIYKELKELSNKGIGNPVNKWEKGLNKHFSKEVQIVSNHMEKFCPTSVV